MVNTTNNFHRIGFIDTCVSLGIEKTAAEHLYKESGLKSLFKRLAKGAHGEARKLMAQSRLQGRNARMMRVINPKWYNFQHYLPGETRFTKVDPLTFKNYGFSEGEAARLLAKFDSGNLNWIDKWKINRARMRAIQERWNLRAGARNNSRSTGTIVNYRDPAALQKAMESADNVNLLQNRLQAAGVNIESTKPKRGKPRYTFKSEARRPLAGTPLTQSPRVTSSSAQPGAQPGAQQPGTPPSTSSRGGNKNRQNNGTTGANVAPIPALGVSPTFDSLYNAAVAHPYMATGLIGGAGYLLGNRGSSGGSPVVVTQGR